MVVVVVGVWLHPGLPWLAAGVAVQKEGSCTMGPGSRCTDALALRAERGSSAAARAANGLEPLCAGKCVYYTSNIWKRMTSER